MNFVGHAAVALWFSGEPEFALGAMLPDFASMIRGRLAPQPKGRVHDGVRLHERTDEAFHGSSGFLELCTQTTERLQSLGLARGPARAVGHIGVEMLLDGWLLEHSPVGRLYIEALEVAASASIGFTAPDATERFAHLHSRLRSYGVPYDYQDTDSVAFRLSRALSGRPRLQLDARSLEIVRTVLPDVKDKVGERRPEIMAYLRSTLVELSD